MNITQYELAHEDCELLYYDCATTPIIHESVYDRILDDPDITIDISPNENSKSTVLYDELIALLHDSAMVKQRSFMTFIVKYIDKNSESLMITGPYKKLYFIDKFDSDPLFPLFDIDKKRITDIIKKSPLIQSKFRTLNNPLFFLLTMLTIIYDEPGDRLNSEAKYLAMIYLAIRFYSSRQGHLWPYEANKEIMDYTMNNINNKFIFKTKGNVINVLRHIALSNDEHIGTKLRSKHTDVFFKYYITNISTRINNILSNIWEIYTKNVKDKKYMNSESDRYDDEKSTIKEINNVSSTITSITSRVYYQIKNNPIDPNMLEDATDSTGLRSASVRNTLDLIIEQETLMLQEIILGILQLYVMDGANKIENIKSRYFAAYCLKLYRVSNSKDPIIIKIKSILDKWIGKYGAMFIRLNRAATRINFRKAIYIYIVSCIIKYV
jgi:hypothetical protein